MSRSRPNGARFAKCCATAFTLLIASHAANAQTLLLDYNFNALTNNSNLVGQGGWLVADSNSGVSPQVLTSPTTANYTGSQSAATSVSSTGASWGRNKFFTSVDFTTITILRIEFDIYRTGNFLAGVGIGGDSPTTSLTAGINGNLFSLRQQNYGTQFNAVGAVFNHSEWYRIATEWDLTTGTGTMFAKNLTNPSATAWQTNTTDAGDGWRQLYFGASLTDPSVSLGIPGSGINALANWDTLFLRTAVSGDGRSSFIDNITVVAIPEPSTAALLLGVVALAAARRGRTRACKNGVGHSHPRPVI